MTIQPHYHTNPSTTVINSNMAVIGAVSRKMLREKRERGISYYTMSKGIGCSYTMLWKIGNNKAAYCGISLLSAIPAYFGSNLVEWLRDELLNEKDKGGI